MEGSLNLYRDVKIWGRRRETGETESQGFPVRGGRQVPREDLLPEPRLPEEQLDDLPHRTSPAGGLGNVVGQGAHFGGHHRKTFAMFSGSDSLNRSIQS